MRAEPGSLVRVFFVLPLPAIVFWVPFTNNEPHISLVTGGSGFLGRRLVERLLAHGRKVRVLGRTPQPEFVQKGVDFVRASLTDADAVRAACEGVGSVFHVAAKVGVWGPYFEYFETNVLGTRALLQGCREHRVASFIYTSTPSVVYDGRDLEGADESLPLTTRCPSHYPVTKALAEAEVLAANSDTLRTVALRPHLIWGVGDPHLVPRVLARARAGRLRIVGSGTNRVDMVHVDNAVDAHLLAEAAIAPEPVCSALRNKVGGSVLRSNRPAAGRAFFITNGEPVLLWNWINDLLRALGEPPVTKRISLRAATAVGAGCEVAWRALRLAGEPPMTRFVASELAKHHWFDISAARRDLGYVPRVSMEAGTAALVESLRSRCAQRSAG